MAARFERMGLMPALGPGRRSCLIIALAWGSLAAGWHGDASARAPSARRTAVTCKQATTQAGKQVADNRIARSRYEIVERYEAGVALLGTEVKSCRKGNINLRDGFAQIKPDGCWLMNVHVGKHDSTGRAFNHEERRPRRLLLRKREIEKMEKAVDSKGFTLVPLRCYFNAGNYLKVEIGVARGLKDYDKRDQLKGRDIQRDVQRELKDFRTT
ncbi:small protein B [Pavlovales sp. CCMP2436]|nr:small protein B [Pavlovales sp. CCMP2436]